MALGYAISRDGADGRPPHVWCHGLLNESSAMFATSFMIGHGCVANLDHGEGSIPDPALFRAAVAMGNRVSPYFAGRRPLRWAAIHYPDMARYSRLADKLALWKDVIYPVYGAYHSLLRRHRPVGIVSDSQLEAGLLKGYKTLFLPLPGELTENMKKAVAAFKAGGGIVISQQTDWRWHLKGAEGRKTVQKFTEAIRPADTATPFTVTGGPQEMHVSAFVDRSGGKMTVAMMNDTSWVWTGAIRPKQDAEMLAKLRSVKPPKPCRNVTLRLRPGRKPARVFEAVSARPLQFAVAKGGSTVVKVPEFAVMAVICVEF